MHVVSSSTRHHTTETATFIKCRMRTHCAHFDPEGPPYYYILYRLIISQTILLLYDWAFQPVKLKGHQSDGPIMHS